MSDPNTSSTESDETCPDCGGQWVEPMREGCKRPWHHADQWADVILPHASEVDRG